MTWIDLAQLQRIAGTPPQLSPDGKTVAYLLSRTDWKAGRLIFQLWRQDVDGGAPVQLTFTDGGVQPGHSRLAETDVIPAQVNPTRPTPIP